MIESEFRVQIISGTVASFRRLMIKLGVREIDLEDRRREDTFHPPHALYNRYLGELRLAAELGIDVVALNEHPHNAYGLMPSPIVVPSVLASRTTDSRCSILGNAICLRDHTLTLAKEHAMIYCDTAGRC